VANGANKPVFGLGNRRSIRLAGYMDLHQRFATNLRRLRHERELSQEQLAHDAGIDCVYASRVERAVTYVGLEIIGKLAAILKVDPAEFFRRSSRSRSRRKAD
jgi:transcriptional regulator with XRE-family HTH domain